MNIENIVNQIKFKIASDYKSISILSSEINLSSHIINNIMDGCESVKIAHYIKVCKHLKIKTQFKSNLRNANILRKTNKVSIKKITLKNDLSIPTVLKAYKQSTNIKLKTYLLLTSNN
jgi:hypothetical protein